MESLPWTVPSPVVCATVGEGLEWKRDHPTPGSWNRPRFRAFRFAQPRFQGNQHALVIFEGTHKFSGHLQNQSAMAELGSSIDPSQRSFFQSKMETWLIPPIARRGDPGQRSSIATHHGPHPTWKSHRQPGPSLNPGPPGMVNPTQDLTIVVPGQNRAGILSMREGSPPDQR